MTAGAEIRYLAIYEALKAHVQGMPANTLLPTENELAEEFVVSRVTIRQALALLNQAGLIERVRGKGTIVSPPKIVRNNIPMTALEDDFRRQGIQFETRILQYEADFRAPPNVAEALKIHAKDKVGYLRLTRIVNRQIVCCEHRYLPASLASRFDPQTVLSRGLAHVVSELANAPIDQVEFETEILPADIETAGILGVAPGAPVFQNSFVYFLADETPVETGKIIYRVDRCKFRAVGRMRI